MQATVPAPPAPRAPEAPPPTLITTVGQGGAPISIAVPKTPEEVRHVLAQRRELNAQLRSVSERRGLLSSEIANAPEGASRAGLEERIKLLDARILELETNIAGLGRQLAAAPPEYQYLAETNSGSDEEEAFFGGAALGAIALLTITFLVRRWRRWRGKGKQPARSAEFPSGSTQRLERLEQGMEAIAVEIERISEGQRFVTKLLAEPKEAVGGIERR